MVRAGERGGRSWPRWSIRSVLTVHSCMTLTRDSRGSRRHGLILSALPGAIEEDWAGIRAIRYKGQLLLSKQVTYLGKPWETYKKRIQLPREWGGALTQARDAGLRVRFVGVYHYSETTIFVDFEPSTYADNAFNNSSAHRPTNDLFQAQTLGQFSRQDKNANSITSIRADHFALYLEAGYAASPHVEILDHFSAEFLDGAKIEGLDAVQEMHAAAWPDTFQNEWAGFYVEFRLSEFLSHHNLTRYVAVQKEKRRSAFDYDLALLDGHGHLEFYGDLKASNIDVADHPWQRRCQLLPVSGGVRQVLVRDLRARDLARTRQQPCLYDRLERVAPVSRSRGAGPGLQPTLIQGPFQGGCAVRGHLWSTPCPVRRGKRGRFSLLYATSSTEVVPTPTYLGISSDRSLRRLGKVVIEDSRFQYAGDYGFDNGRRGFRILAQG